MSKYTPTVAEVREYVENGGEYAPWVPPDPEVETRRGEAFDRMIAEVERAAAEKALVAAADAVGDPRFKDDQNTTTLGEIKRWLRECAASYRRNEGENK